MGGPWFKIEIKKEKPWKMQKLVTKEYTFE